MRLTWAIVAIVPLAVLGVVSAGMAWNQREDDPAFIVAQQQLRRITQADVQRTLRDAPDPKTNRKSSAAKVSCHPGRDDDRRNPWRCRISYPSGERPRYSVTIAADGSYAGRRLDLPGQISGCCVQPGEGR